MDHAIDALKPFLEQEIGQLVEQMSTGEYKKLSDCPWYHSAKALTDAIHALEKYHYGKHMTISVQEQVKWALEF